MKDKNLENMIEFIEGHVPETMREGKVPGFSIAVVKDDETVYAQGFGARDPAKSLPATPDTLYGIGSCTKSFVGIAINEVHSPNAHVDHSRGLLATVLARDDHLQTDSDAANSTDSGSPPTVNLESSCHSHRAGSPKP